MIKSHKKRQVQPRGGGRGDQDFFVLSHKKQVH